MRKEYVKGINIFVSFTECDEGSFKCDTSVRGRCLPDTWLCDGYTDCPGGEDEQQQICGLYETIYRVNTKHSHNVVFM